MPQVTPAAQGRPQTTQKAQPKKLPVFEVFDPTPVETGNLVGFFSVRIGRGETAITVHKWRLIQQQGQAPWISPPQEIWTDEAGQRRYKTLFEFPRSWRQALTNVVIAAFEGRAQR